MTEGCPCHDCGVETSGLGNLNELYMLRNEIWKLTGVGEGYLCIGCLETRLGRELTGADFFGCPLNSMPEFQRSERLIDRLGR